jgi:gluconolactonase
MFIQPAKLATCLSLFWGLTYAQSQTAIPGVIAASTPVEVVKEGFVFTEGPIGAADGSVYFTDVRARKLYKIDPAGNLSTIREESRGANGLAFNNSGDLFAAEGAGGEGAAAGKRISRANQTGNPIDVATEAGGKRFGSPNDLTLDARGGIYFTDPGTQPFDAPDKRGDVYYLPPGAKEPKRIDGEVKFPNGVALSTDGKTLLVSDTTGVNVWAYDVQADGSAKNKRVFAAVPQLTDGRSLGDGICIDRASRVYVTTGAGIQVFDRAGKFLGVIKTPKQPANCAFGGRDKKILYVTARESVYKIRMIAQGPDRPGK